MIRNLFRALSRFAAFGIVAVFGFSVTGFSQASSEMTQKQITYNNHVYVFKKMGAGVSQILKDGQAVGAIIPDGSGGEKVIGPTTNPLPEDILVAYGMYKAGDSPTPPAAGTAETPAAPATPPAANTVLGTDGMPPTYDTATKTAKFADGTVVTFVDNDHAKLHWPEGFGNFMDFDLVYHGNSAGGFMRGVAASNRGVMGQSMAGSGVKFMVAATANSRGGEMFDTGEGTTAYTAKLQKFKPMIHAVVQSADAAKAAGASVDDLRVVKSIRANNFGIK